MPNQHTTNTRVERICEHCGAHFTVKAYFLKHGWGKFCSQACASAHHVTQMEITCQQCGKKFMAPRHTAVSGRKKFCSRECASASLNGHHAPFEERLWSRIDRSGGPDACWTWTAGTINGYGMLKRNSKRVATHRAVWEITHGPITDGLWVLHKCDNPPCCNPAHLFLGTAADNAHDRDAKGRGNFVRPKKQRAEKEPSTE